MRLFNTGISAPELRSNLQTGDGIEPAGLDPNGTVTRVRAGAMGVFRTETYGPNAAAGKWVKIATVSLGNAYHFVAFQVHLSNGYTSRSGMTAQVSLATSLSTGFQNINVDVSACSSPFTPDSIVAVQTKNYPVDGANEVEVWVKCTGYWVTTLYSFSNLYIDSSCVFTPTPSGSTWVSAPTAGTQTVGVAIWAVDSLSVSSLTGLRMVSTDASDNLVSLDAAASRTLIGAQQYLGYAPVDRAGDTMTGPLTLPQLDIGHSRIVKGTTAAIAEGQEVLLLRSAYLIGEVEIWWNSAANRVERMVIDVTSMNYDDTTVLTVRRYTSYQGNNCCGLIRVYRNADSSQRYLTMVMSNLNGGTAGMQVVVRGLSSASCVFGEAVPGSLTELKRIQQPSRVRGYDTTGAVRALSLLGTESGQSLLWDLQVVGASTANIASLSGALTHDGIVYATGDMILLKNQTTGSQNGVWVVNTAGAWSRSTAHDSSDEIRLTRVVLSSDGTTNRKGNAWLCTNASTITVGSTSIAFAQEPIGIGTAASQAAAGNHTHTTLANLALTGVPTTPTAAAGTNTTQVASTAFVRTEVANLVASAPGALDTLDELAAALGDDANFAATVTTALGTKALAVDVNVGTTLESLGDPFTSRSSYNGRGGARTANGSGPFGGFWYNVLDVRHRNTWGAGDVWGGELAWGMTANWWRAAFRSRDASGAATPWVEFWTDANRPVVNTNNGSGTGGLWFKLLTIVLGTQYESAHAVVDFTLNRNSPTSSHVASGTIYFGAKQQNPMSSPLDIVSLVLKNQIGIISHANIIAITSVDNSSTKNIELWIQNPSDFAAIRAVVSDMYGSVTTVASGGSGVAAGSLPAGSWTTCTPLTFDPVKAMRTDVANVMGYGSSINFGASEWKHNSGGGGSGYAVGTDRITPDGLSTNKPCIEFQFGDNFYPSADDWHSSLELGWIDASPYVGIRFHSPAHNGGDRRFDVFGISRETYGVKQTFTADGTVDSSTTLIEINSGTDRTITLYTPTGGEIIEVVGLAFGTTGHRLYPPSGSTIYFSKSGGVDVTCGPSGSPTTIFRVRTGVYRLIGGSNGSWYYMASNN